MSAAIYAPRSEDFPTESRLTTLNSFQRWRLSCFYPKSDLPFPDAVLRGEEAGALDTAELTRACSKALGETVCLAPLAERGTLHRLWRVRRANGPDLILRANALPAWLRDYSLLIDAYAGEWLHCHGIPVMKPRALDLSRAGCATDWLLLEEARGISLRAFDSSDEQMLPLLRDLGRVLAQVHQVEVNDGYGLLDVQALDNGENDLAGSHTTWDDYLHTRLDSHLETCMTLAAITKSEARRIHQLFDDCRGIYPEWPRLLHGDPGSHNVFAANGRITALIDWEDALAGDPVYDIAFWATFHPERRHDAFLAGYCEVAELPDDFERRFLLYYVRVSLAKTVLRHRLGLKDRPGREPAACDDSPAAEYATESEIPRRSSPVPFASLPSTEYRVPLS